MNCRETRPLLPLFFDGEIEARQMRAIALHSTRCPECETELRHLERVQEFVSSYVGAQLEAVDLDEVWAGIAPRLDTVTRPRHAPWRDWWDTVGSRWQIRTPVYAALAAACLLAFVLWQRETVTPSPEIASVDNSAILDSVQSNVESVALIREPETNTMVLWITDDEPLTDFGGPP